MLSFAWPGSGSDHRSHGAPVSNASHFEDRFNANSPRDPVTAITKCRVCPFAGADVGFRRLTAYGTTRSV